MHVRTIAAGVIAAALTTGCSAAAAAPAAAPTPTSAPTHAAHAAPTQRTGRFAPSAAWRKADLATRAEIFSDMVWLVGDQTCVADVAHAYQGTARNRPHVHDEMSSRLHPGRHYRIGVYVTGVCDGPQASLGLYAR